MFEEDAYRYGESLTAHGLFQLIAEEALRDGKVCERDMQILGRFVRILQVPLDDAKALIHRAQHKRQRGALGLFRGFSPQGLYKRCLRYLLAQGEISAPQQRMLDTFRKVFSMTVEHHDSILVLARQDLRMTESMPLPRLEPAA